jgi:predicted HicB family RNase H-like nuclease
MGVEVPVQVAAADADRPDLEQHFPRTGVRRQRRFDNFESVGRNQVDGFHKDQTENYIARPPVSVRELCTHILCYTVYVSKNLTLTLDEETLREARKVALDRNTSVNQLVRDYLARLVRETDEQAMALRRLDEIFRKKRVTVGRRTWKREDLHER